MKRFAPRTVTVSLANHRPETAAAAYALMAGHDAIFLEEPPSDALAQMLSGRLAIKDYVLTIDTEYPEFSREMARYLRRLGGDGFPFRRGPGQECPARDRSR